MPKVCRHLTALMDCIDQYVQQQPAFLRLDPLGPVVRPHQVPLLLSLGKVLSHTTSILAFRIKTSSAVLSLRMGSLDQHM